MFILGGGIVKVTYDDRHDLLYLELDETAERVRNRDVGDGIVLDVAEDGRIAGIEILGASRIVNLRTLLPVEYAPVG
jgi:uncharacterized protein YuzE